MLEFVAFGTRPLKKRCRILPAGGLGVSPSFKKKSPKTGGYRGLIEAISDNFYCHCEAWSAEAISGMMGGMAK